MKKTKEMMDGTHKRNQEEDWELPSYLEDLEPQDRSALAQLLDEFEEQMLKEQE